MNKSRLQLLSIIALLVLGATLGDRILRSPILFRHHLGSYQAQSSRAFDAVRDIQETRKNNLYSVNPLPYLKLSAPYFNFLSILSKQITGITPIKEQKPITPQTSTNQTQASTSTKPVQPPPRTNTTPTPNPSPLNSIPAPKSSITNIINTVPDSALSNLDPKNSVVNILCKSTENGVTKNISSSGILISGSGLILTNAHVGVHPFLDTYSNDPVNCFARFGSPAQAPEPVSLIYISEFWTKKHKGEINGSFSADSGENDFAILKTSSINGNKLAQKAELRNSANTLSFSADSGNMNNLFTGQAIRLFGYPLTSNNSNLYRKEEPLQILSLANFNLPSKSLIETSVSNVGKSGASGGSIIDDQKYLVGLIANIVSAGSNGETKVHALTMDYVYTSLKNETGVNLFDLINSDGSSLKRVFEERYLNQVKDDLLQGR